MSSKVETSGKIRKAALLLRSPLLSFGRYQNLFLISHMRARTSLLSHILGSHEEIAGYYEQHIARWKRASDLRLRASLLEERLVTPRTRYLFDKVLHDHLDPAPAASAVRVILLRQPETTVQSIIRMGLKRGTKWQDEQEAVTYYCNRLQQILQKAQRCSQPQALIISEDIVDRPDAVLQELSSFLKLGTWLNAQYDSFEKTGQAVSGDPSGAIQAGRILRRKHDQGISLTPGLLDQAQERYHQVLAGLEAINCRRLS